MSEVKYPNIKVRLAGGDGNAFSILAKVKQQLEKNKVLREEQEVFMTEATSGDYDHLLRVVMRWVVVQ